MSFIMDILLGYGREKAARADAHSVVVNHEEDARRQDENREAFRAAAPVYAGLCYPLQFTYAESQQHARFRLVSLRELRKSSEGWLLACDCSLYGDQRIFRSEHMSDIGAGREGSPLLNLDALAKRFSVFAKGAYPELLDDIHVMVFLAHADGDFCPAEKEVMRQYIASRCREADSEAILAYAVETHVTLAAFQEALNQLAQHPAGAIEATARAAQALIEADGTLSSQEERFIAQLNSALGGVSPE